MSAERGLVSRASKVIRGGLLAIPILGTVAIAGATCTIVLQDMEADRLRGIENVSETGMQGDLQLVDLRELPGFNELNSGFAIINETRDGKTSQYLEFAWETGGKDKRLIVSKLPIEKIQFKKVLGQGANSSVNFGVDSLSTVYKNPNDAVFMAKSVVMKIADKDAARFNLASSSK